MTADAAPIDRPLNICILGDEAAYRNLLPDNELLESEHCLFLGRAATTEQVLNAMPDADVILADAIATVPGEMIAGLPSLRLVNSEGVGYEKFDLAAAAAQGIPVCNNPGCNAGAVAEQAILLMLGLLRNVVAGDAAVRAGRQMEAKMARMRAGITDLADCAVGIVGLGQIGQATAARLRAFGARVLYTGRARKSPELEERLGVTWAPLPEMLPECDFVSLHCAVTPETRGLASADFLARMRPGSYLVNTARGELVDNEALVEALESGRLAGAGLDTVAPEPVTCDNPLLHLSEGAAARVLFSPHVGGITTGSLRRAQTHLWANVARVKRGERPDGIVNGV